LKRTLLILSLLILTTLTQAQDSRVPSGPDDGKLVKFYPNPATSYITFDLQKIYKKGLTISVFSFLGKKMHETQNAVEKTTVSLTDYNRGVYIYYVTDPNGKVIDTGKFQVSK